MGETHKMVWHNISTSQGIEAQNVRNDTYLVTITPGVVLHTDVLVRVFRALLKRGHVLPVLPVLLPEVVGVDGAKDKARNDSAGVYG
jgi:hypothetical protein